MKEFIDKLIERLEEEKNRTYFVQTANPQMQRRYSHYGQSVFDKAISIVNQLAEEYKVSEMLTGWIPCSERLPEIGQMCLCSVNYKKYTDVPYDIIFCKYEERYINRWADWYTAWMPLPAPYTEGE